MRVSRYVGGVLLLSLFPARSSSIHDTVELFLGAYKLRGFVLGFAPGIPLHVFVAQARREL